MRLTAQSIRDRKNSGEALVALTAYDFHTARIEASAGVHLILVGDSIGDDIARVYQSAADEAAGSAVIIGVLGENQSKLKKQMPDSATSIVLTQPVTLRDLRKSILRLLPLRSDAS